MQASEQQRIRETAWTGFEDLRREQGICLPPARPAKKGSRFLIPAGKPCTISEVSPMRWRMYATGKNVGFERYEFYKAGVYEFRAAGSLMRVPADASSTARTAATNRSQVWRLRTASTAKPTCQTLTSGPATSDPAANECGDGPAAGRRRWKAAGRRRGAGVLPPPPFARWGPAPGTRTHPRQLITSFLRRFDDRDLH